MKLRGLLTAVFVVLLSISFVAPEAHAYVSVKGYYKSNGTYVAPHVRSNPNGVKYDNYGWTASQGLYNDTYGTRGSSWDTPTYVTDPYYYEGKALYESGGSSSGSSNYTGSTNSYLNTTYSNPTESSSGQKKEERTISSVVKGWVEANPGADCLSTKNLVDADRLECETYKKAKNLYSWKAIDPYSSYPTCAGSTYYADACPFSADFVCKSDGKAYCVPRQTQNVVQPSSKKFSSGLTEIQVTSILSLLQSFNADQSVLESVKSALMK